MIVAFIQVTLINSATISVDNNFQIDINKDNSLAKFKFTLKNSQTGWMGLCFSKFMYPADCIVCSMNGNTPSCFDGFNPGIKGALFYPAPIPDDNSYLNLNKAAHNN